MGELRILCSLVHQPKLPGSAASPITTTLRSRDVLSAIPVIAFSRVDDVIVPPGQ